MFKKCEEKFLAQKEKSTDVEIAKTIQKGDDCSFHFKGKNLEDQKKSHFLKDNYDNGKTDNFWFCDVCNLYVR